MNIKINANSFVIDGHSLTYDSYYFEHIRYHDLTSAEVLRDILARGARVILSYDASEQTFFLPFSLEDERIECLKVEIQGDTVFLQCVCTSENGWAIDFDMLEQFIVSAHEICEEPSGTIGVYPKKDFISGLLNATIIDGLH